jgi:hypothetical protein
MHMPRNLRSGIIVGSLALGIAGAITGCDSSDTTTGKQAVQTDPAEARKREQMIQDLYKSNPPAKGPGGKVQGKAAGTAKPAAPAAP